MTTLRPGKPPTYMTTVDPSSAGDAVVLKGLRDVVARLNRAGPQKFRVALSPRAIKKEHRWKYAGKNKPKPRLEDASSVDVYVVENFNCWHEPGQRPRKGPR